MSINDEVLAAQSANVDQTQAPWHSPRGPLETTDGDDQYKHVAASQTDAALSATGAAGDMLAELWAIPATTSPGAVSIKDGTVGLDGGGSATVLFAGGASSVVSMAPFRIPAPRISRNGAWKITTGANVSVVAILG